MKCKCDKCGGAEHEISEMTINIDKKSEKSIHDIEASILKVVKDKKVSLEVLLYALAHLLEHVKQAGFELGKEGHHLETIIHISRNTVIDNITQS